MGRTRVPVHHRVHLGRGDRGSPSADFDNLVAAGLLLGGRIEASTLLGWVRTG